MKKRSAEDYNWALEELERERQLYTKQKEVWDKQSEIRDVKRSMRRWQPPSTTKVLMAYIFLNCTVVEIYSMVAMWHLQDLSALYTLITAVVGETISFAVYAAKSYHETKQEEIIRLERDKMSVDAQPGTQPESDAWTGGDEDDFVTDNNVGSISADGGSEADATPDDSGKDDEDQEDEETEDEEL